MPPTLTGAFRAPTQLGGAGLRNNEGVISEPGAGAGDVDVRCFNTKGDGLGARFLRHVERTRLFLFLITLDLTPGRDPISDFHALQQELLVHDPSLLDRASMVVLTQMDRPEVAELLPLVREKLEPSMGRIYPISAVTGHGLTELRRAIATQLAAAGQWGQQIGL